ncbi:MAG: NAD-dependent epimerase/dehydratase family protein [Acidimicrobiales bacterium]
MHVAITGGAGFIGANLAAHLAEAGVSVVALDDLSTGRRENLDGVPAELVEGSILDPAALDRVMARADAVVHLAARPSVPRSLTDPVASHRVNDTGTIEVLEAVRRAAAPPQVIVASSSSVYGANPHLPKHEDLAPRPVSPYAATKLATESYALAWGASFGLDVLAVRFFNVFGPLQSAGHAYAAVVPAFVDAALSGTPLPVHGDGSQSRDFTYVGSVCRVLADAIDRRVVSPEPMNLAFGSRITLLELITAIEGELGRVLERHHAPVRAGDVPHSQADTTRIEKLFPDVEPVPFEDGLRATVDWFRTLDPGERLSP